MKIWTCHGQITLSKTDKNPKPDHHNINAHTKFGENTLTYTRCCLETKTGADRFTRQMDEHTDVQPM